MEEDIKYELEDLKSIADGAVPPELSQNEAKNIINFIENLINKNKELEEDRNENSILYIKPMNENLEDKIFRLEKDLEQIIKERDYFKSKVIEYNEKINNYIPKSKVRELIQDIDETIYITKSDETKFFMSGLKNSIQELLQEE